MSGMKYFTADPYDYPGFLAQYRKNEAALGKLNPEGEAYRARLHEREIAELSVSSFGGLSGLALIELLQSERGIIAEQVAPGNRDKLAKQAELHTRLVRVRRALRAITDKKLAVV